MIESNEQALAALVDGTSHERLKAARYLARNATTTELAPIRGAQRTETVSYVRASLDMAVRRLVDHKPNFEIDPVDELDVPPEVQRQIYNKAVEYVTGLVLHELAAAQ